MLKDPVLIGLLVLILVVFPIRSLYRVKKNLSTNPLLSLFEKTALILVLFYTRFQTEEVLAELYGNYPLLLLKITLCIAVVALIDGVSLLISIRVLNHSSVGKSDQIIESTTFKFSAGKITNQLLTVIFLLVSGIWEEIFFRALLFSISEALALNVLLFVIISSVLFALQHLYAGITQVIYSFFFGIMFSLLYYASGSLVAVILCHFFGNMFTFYVSRPILIRKANRKPVFF